MKKMLVIAALLMIGYANAQTVSKVGPICITVNNIDSSIKFYTSALHFTLLGKEEFLGEEPEKLMGKFGVRYQAAHLQLGDEYVDLIDFITSGGRRVPETEQSNDLDFQHIAIVVSDMDSAFAELRNHHVGFISTGPQTLPMSNMAAAGIKAFYFHDNDNHSLEIIYFPKGKGKPKWQNPQGRLFLGIDHTAIGVSNTDTSLVFWGKGTMFEKKGESHNVGMEQAHLNFVEGAELLITGLSAPAGPGVEFLQYIKPGAGKTYPTDTQCDDLWNWETKLYTQKIDDAYQWARQKGYKMLSKGLAVFNGKKNFIVRDPDGHAVWFVEN